MREVSLIKFKTDSKIIENEREINDKSFYHFSVIGDSSYCIRYVSNGQLKELRQSDKNALSLKRIEKDILKKVPYKTAVSVKGIEDYWVSYLKIINSLPDEVHKTIKEGSSILSHIAQIVTKILPSEHIPKLIKLTPIRELYGLLGDDIPKTLIKVFNESINKLQNYKNTESFKPKPEKKTSKKSKNPTKKLQTYFKKKKCVSILGQRYKFLADELAPLRSTSSLYETGESAKKSGSGGIDILCYNETSKLPVIIEYKSKTDHSLLYALIQLLTYASELVTKNQFERLRNNYEPISNKDKVELVIMYDKGGRADFKDVVEHCKKMIKNKKFKEYVLRISFIEVEEKVDGTYEFCVQYSCNSATFKGS